MKATLSLLLFLIFLTGYSQKIEPREDFLGLIKKEIKNSRCNESGKITIEISANSVGNVIATKYIEGNTKVSKCLIEEALHHAKNLQFTPDKGAPETQTTTVIYDIKQNKD